MQEEKVILVDTSDQPIGLMEKMQAHKEGRLHRAFSILIFNDKGEMLIHQRANNKYHCGGLWTNACCSHPRANESLEAAAIRRLKEEMGFQTELKKIGTFIYKAEFDNGLTEHEFDHLFLGFFNKKPSPNPKEVMDWKYVEIETLKKDIQSHPDEYTIWFKEIMSHHLDKVLNSQNYA